MRQGGRKYIQKASYACCYSVEELNDLIESTIISFYSLEEDFSEVKEYISS